VTVVRLLACRPGMRAASAFSVSSSVERDGAPLAAPCGRASA